jgi:hypothetical protein
VHTSQTNAVSTDAVQTVFAFGLASKAAYSQRP